MKYIVLLIHGINTKNPAGSVGQFRTFFEAAGVPCIIVDYDHVGFIRARQKNKKVAEKIATITKAIKKNNGVKIVALSHSNGCAISHIATTEFLAPIDYCIYLNAALKRTLAPGPSVEQCDVYYSPSDTPVKAAKALSKVTRFISKDWFDARPWGEMGAYGYEGDDARMIGYDKENNSPVVSKTHSDILDWDKTPFFGPVITNRVFDFYSAGADELPDVL